MVLKKVYQNVIDGDIGEVEENVGVALKTGFKAEEILNQALVPAMEEVGRLFEAGEFYIPEMLVAAQAMHKAMNVIKPYLITTHGGPKSKIGLGTVKGDLHDLGKKLVAIMLEGSGFEVVDLGVDVAPETFVKAAQDGVQIIGMSALLTTTMGGMQNTIDTLKKAGLRDQTKVIVGGAPLTQEFANDIGADGFSADASGVPRLVKHLIAKEAQ